jgi:hypothetical protein
MTRSWLLWLLVSHFAVCVSASGFAAEGPAEKAASPVVQVTIDYADGVQKHFSHLGWKRGMTVLDAMLAADQHPRGIAIVHRGKGATALLTRIDDVENEGAGRNWVYRVNGKLADRSMGVYELQSGDTVLWKFEKYQ